MSPFLKTIVLLLSALLMASDSNVVYAKTHVRLYNFIDNNQDLTLHCQSGDDDLGEHLLHPLDSFEWSFGVDIIGTTLYYCSFQWQGFLHKFDIFKGERDDAICNGMCMWRIKSGGPCMFNPANLQYDICYGWSS